MLIPALLALSLVHSDPTPIELLRKNVKDVQSSSAPRAFTGPMPDGSGRRASGLITFRWTVSTRFEETGDTSLAGIDVCGNSCNGKKHAKHLECDRTCDTPCNRMHMLTIQDPIMFFDDEDAYDLGRELRKLFDRAERTGIKVDQEAQPIADAVYRNAEIVTWKELDEADGLTLFLQHGVSNPYRPCTMDIRSFVYRDYDVFSTATLTADFSGTVEGTNEPVKLSHQIGTKEFFIGIVSTFDPQPREGFTALCGCEKTESPPEDHGWIPQFWKDSRVTPLGLTAGLGYGKLGEWDRGAGLTITGNDLNTTQFEIVGMGGLWLPAGTRLVPDNDKVQEVVVRDSTWLGSLPSWEFNLTGNESSKLIKTLCVEMNKLEPSPKTKFRISAPTDYTLAHLADIAQKSQYRGPWDQARVWIYTDKATYAQIKDKLIPAPRPGQYREALYDVVRATHGRKDRKGLDALLTPEMLADPGKDPRAVDWAVQVLMKRDPKKTISALATGSPNLWSQPSIGLSHVRDLVHSLSHLQGKDSVAAIEALLMHATPANQLEAVKQFGALEPLSWWSYGSTDHKAAFDRISKAFNWQPQDD